VGFDWNMLMQVQLSVCRIKSLTSAVAGQQLLKYTSLTGSSACLLISPTSVVGALTNTADMSCFILRPYLWLCRSFLVSCFGDVIKLLKKHSKPCQRLDKVVHTVLQDLKPTAASAGRLLARLEAAVMGHKGAPSL
jgi:hypothetical protein